SVATSTPTCPRRSVCWSPPTPRGQVLGGAVQVGGDLLAGDAGDATDDDLLAERGRGLVDERLHGGAVGLDGEQRLRRLGTRGDGRREHAVGERDEGLVLRDEVGLRVDLDEHADLATRGGGVDLDGDETVGGRAALALRDALEALDANDLERLVGVAVRLV